MVDTQPADQELRDRIANDLDVSMLVEASAGTGKTTCLVSRMVSLLRQGQCDISTLATVTFTRKAAAELRTRFQRELEQAAIAASGEQQNRLTQALEHFERCFIGTIHAFCARIIRERSIESEVDPGFVELDETVDANLRQQAWRDYVATLIAIDDPILPELEQLGLKVTSEEKYASSLATELDELGLEPAQLGPAFMSYAEFSDVQDWPAEPVDLPDLKPCVDALKAYVEHIIAIDLPVNFGSDRLLPEYAKLRRVMPRSDLTQTSQLMNVLEYFKHAPSKRFVTHKYWPGKKAQAVAEHERWNEFCLAHAQPLLLAWREHRYEPVMRAIRPALQVYDQLRRERSALSFQDLLMTSARMLREQPEARKYFRERFTHLLIDEFQDTDPIQAEVMLLLTADDPSEPDWQQCRPAAGSLFVVGDPKQSIYRFRRADILTYEKVREIIQDAGGEVITLSANFRSTAPIIDWVNDCFADKFPAAATVYSPADSPLTVGRQDSSAAAETGVSRLVIPDTIRKVDELAAFDSDWIARSIRAAIDEKCPVNRNESELASGLPVHAVAGDFMIVLWNKKHTTTYARALQRYGLPNSVTGGSVLNEVPELRLLHLVMVAVTRSDDPIALTAVLRSELFGIADATLYEVVRHGGRLHYQAPIPAALSEADKESLDVPISRLKRYSRWVSKMPTVAAIERIAADLGLPARACACDDGNTHAGSLMKAIELLRSVDDQLSVSDHVAALGRLVDQSESHDGIPVRPAVESSVRVMNLHQCKGLEAAVVFLAFPAGRWSPDVQHHIDRSGERPSGYLPIYGLARKQWDSRPLLAQPQGWDEFVDEEQRFLDAEQDRLLYVATTRSRNKLVVSQQADSRRNEKNYWQPLEADLQNATEFGSVDSIEQTAHAPIDLSEHEWKSTVDSIGARWQQVRLPTYATRAIKETVLTKGPKPHGEQAQGAEWGTVVHRLLEALMNMQRSPEDNPDLRPFALSLLDQEGLTLSFVDEVLKTVNGVAASDIWARAQDAPQCLTEVPVAWMEPTSVLPNGIPTLTRGVIDLVFREAGAWVIVDYKTERVDGSLAAELGAYYQPQIDAYTKAWQDLTQSTVGEKGILLTHTSNYVTL